MSRLRWLLAHPSFRARPLRTIMGILYWECTRLRRRPVVLRFDEDLDLIVEPCDGVGRLISYFGMQDPVEFQVIDCLLRPDDCVLDVGANVGSYALFCAKRVASGHVWAIEADPSTFRKLRANIILNGFDDRVTCLQAAASDQAGAVYLDQNSDSAKRQALSTPPLSASAVGVRSLCIDDSDDLMRAEINFLKMDIEGHEPNALRGMSRMFTHHPPEIVFIETRLNFEYILSFLARRGYCVFTLKKCGEEWLATKPMENQLNTWAFHESFAKEGFRRMNIHHPEVLSSPA